MIRFSIIVFCFLTCEPLSAQDDFGWWNLIHNWDGHTPWNQYMIISTSFLGPNALPVPEVPKGRIDSSAELEVAGDYHFRKGDETINVYTRGYLPLYNNRIAFSMDVVPYEWFKTDTITRDQRAARTKSGKGGSTGDIYFYSDIQILRNQPRFPDILLQIALRTSSGTNLGNARFTDGPGYFFNISAGKNYIIKKSSLRLFLMGGFYVYQTFDVQHLQNDCMLYGGGVDIAISKLIFSQSLAGYSGYLDIGDKPMVYRASLKLKKNYFDWKVSYQWGLNDYSFQRIRLSLIWHIVPPFK